MIIIGITGSIAAFKAIDLAKLLIESGYQIKIVLSRSAVNFVSTLTLKSLFPGMVYLADEDIDREGKMLHISLAKQAKFIVIAPASANMISKITNGLADCLLSTLCLATEAPILIAPAMNTTMWNNKYVQENITKLDYVIGPANGKQACGDEGPGRMVEPQEIVEYIKYFNYPQILKNKNIIITAGPSIEKIDPVRFITNFSSGKMGYAIAKIAKLMGANVTLVSGPTNLAPPIGVDIIHVRSGDEYLNACLNRIKNCDILIGAAAIADYIPEEYQKEKIKKTSEKITLNLKKNVDVISSIKSQFKNIFVVGFASETNDLIQNGTQKLKSKNLDLIAINDVSDGKVFGQDENALHVFSKKGSSYEISSMSKENVASELLKIIANLFEN